MKKAAKSLWRSAKRRRIDLGIALLLSILSFTLACSFSRFGFDPHHTGLMYKGALDVANGGVIFRDTFTQYGALVTLLQALGILLFGESVTSIMTVTALFYGANFLLFYLLCRVFLCRTVSILATLFTVVTAPFLLWVFHPWASVYAIFFVLLSLGTLLEALKKNSRTMAALSGLFIALAFWCRQPVGIVYLFGAVAVLGFLWLLQQKSCPVAARNAIFLLLFLLIGVAVGVLLLLIPIIALGAANDFYRQSIKAMFHFASSRAEGNTSNPIFMLGSVLGAVYGMPFLGGWHAGFFALYAIASTAMILLYAWRVPAAAKKGAVPYADIAVLTLSVFALAGCHQFFPVGCLRHWYWGSFLCFIPFLFSLKELAALLARHKKLSAYLTPRRQHVAALIAAAILLSPVFVFRIVGGSATARTGFGEFQPYENEYYTHLDGLRLSDSCAAYYDTLFESVYTVKAVSPDINVINTTENAIFAVFGENFCPLFNNAGDFYYEEYPALLTAYVAEAQPVVIGPEAPAEGYALWRTLEGDHGDDFAEYHRMPANIYVPAELLPLLPK